jgi:hypothetical protein
MIVGFITTYQCPSPLRLLVFDFQGMMQGEYVAFIKHEARSCAFDTSFPYKCTPFSEGLYSLEGKLGLILLYQ